MKSTLLKNVAQPIVRFQNKMYFQYRHRVRRLRYGLRRLSQIFWVLFIGASLFISAVTGAEKILSVPSEQLGPLKYLVPLAQWVTAKVSTDSIGEWLIDAGSLIFTNSLILALLTLVSIIAIPAVSLSLIWRAVEYAHNYQAEKSARRLKALQTALEPVPSRMDVWARFLTVFISVWLGLSGFELLFRWLGYCLPIVNDDCEYTALNVFVWLIVAIVGATISISGMHQRRAIRAGALKQVLVYRMSFFRKAWDLIKVFSVAIIIVLAVGFLMAMVMLWADPQIF